MKYFILAAILFLLTTQSALAQNGAARITVSATVVPDCTMRVTGNELTVKCTRGTAGAVVTVRDGASNGVVADAKNVSTVTFERLAHDGDYVATIDL